MTNKDVKLYEVFEIKENLPSGYTLTQMIEKKKKAGSGCFEWQTWYKTSAPVRLCPIYGDTRKCAKCDHFTLVFDGEAEPHYDCDKPFTSLSTPEVTSMINLALQHGIEVKKY